VGRRRGDATAGVVTTFDVDGLALEDLSLFAWADLAG
jgi:hypothetical protein